MEFLPFTRRDFLRSLGIVAAGAGVFACRVSVPQPIATEIPSQGDPYKGTSVPPVTPFENEGDQLVFTEKQRAMYDQIRAYYEERNLPYILDQNYFLVKALKPGETLPIRETVTVDVLPDKAAKVDIILRLAPALLGEKAKEVLWKIDMTDTSYATIDEKEHAVKISDTYLNQEIPQRRQTALHELFHLIDLESDVYDLDTLLEMELIKTKLLFENGGPAFVYQNLYADFNSQLWDRNPLFLIGQDFKDHLDEYLPASHPQTSDIIQQVAEWESVDTFSERDYVRLGSLLMDVRESHADFQFVGQGEQLFAEKIWLMEVEAFAEAATQMVNMSKTFLERNERASENAELMRRYISFASGQELSSLADLQNLIRYGLVDIEPLPFEIRFMPASLQNLLLLANWFEKVGHNIEA